MRKQYEFLTTVLSGIGSSRSEQTRPIASRSRAEKAQERTFTRAKRRPTADGKMLSGTGILPGKGGLTGINEEVAEAHMIFDIADSQAEPNAPRIAHHY